MRIRLRKFAKRLLRLQYIFVLRILSCFAIKRFARVTNYLFSNRICEQIESLGYTFPRCRKVERGNRRAFISVALFPRSPRSDIQSIKDVDRSVSYTLAEEPRMAFVPFQEARAIPRMAAGFVW